jgi:hypothetical protein
MRWSAAGGHLLLSGSLRRTQQPAGWFIPQVAPGIPEAARQSTAHHVPPPCLIQFPDTGPDLEQCGDPPPGWSGRAWNGDQLHNTFGLAFSGGGIRSATFNLGVLQQLQRLDSLRQFDYLSTVPGRG